MKTLSENDPDFICEITAPCFGLLTAPERDLVRLSKTQVQFRKGENLAKQGTFATYVMFVASGLIKQYIEGSSDRNFNIKVVVPGQFIGLSAVFTKGTFNYSANALTDSQVFLIEKQAIETISKQNGEFAHNIIRRYCEQNETLFETIGLVMFKQMNGRLAQSLLYLDACTQGYGSVFGLLTRHDLADFAGLSTETTVKLLKSFEKDGLVRLDGKDIILLNKSGLEEVSRVG